MFIIASKTKYLRINIFTHAIFYTEYYKTLQNEIKENPNRDKASSWIVQFNIAKIFVSRVKDPMPRYQNPSGLTLVRGGG